MNVFPRIFLLLLLVPFVELYVLVQVAAQIQWVPTIALMILAGMVGTWLARREGLRTLRRIQEDMGRGVAPADGLIEGLMVLLAGAFFVLPGFLSDVCGLALLLPPVRRWIAARVRDSINRRVTPGTQVRDNFIEVEVLHAETAPRAARPSFPMPGSPSGGGQGA